MAGTDTGTISRHAVIAPMHLGSTCSNRVHTLPRSSLVRLGALVKESFGSQRRTPQSVRRRVILKRRDHRPDARISLHAGLTPPLHPETSRPLSTRLRIRLHSSCTPYDANSEPCEGEVVDLPFNWYNSPFNRWDVLHSLTLLTVSDAGALSRGTISRDYSTRPTKGRRFDPGVVFRARATLLAEGAHGSLSRQAVAMYDLRHGKEAQTYEIGIKEVWRVEEVAAVGTVYHMADGPVSISLIVGPDHKIPHIVRFSARKITLFRVLLGAGTCLAYGARTLTEGGLQSLLRLDFPGRDVGWLNFGFFEV
ncbi:hypothetical protein K438DRAFT_1782769 [Mycena galopus ATCC 62051]|nr:hypothetical protein K438DRAFT_1782769 [Mycena galopus ATCC 62051]